jgi:hypothetical protein
MVGEVSIAKARTINVAKPAKHSFIVNKITVPVVDICLGYAPDVTLIDERCF